MASDPARRRIRFETRLLLLSLAVALPVVAAFAAALEVKPLPRTLAIAIGTIAAGLAVAIAYAVRRLVVRPLQTLANLLAALREGDFSFRTRVSRADDVLGLVLTEANAMADTLRRERLGAAEAQALLSAVMSEVDVAIFTFDEERRLRLVNRAGERLIGRTADEALGRGAEELRLAECFEGAAARTVAFPGRAGADRWSLRRTSFREQGQPRELVLLSDVSQTLREEERHVWERLVRVLGHEVNNSLAPIKSIAESLRSMLRAQPPPPEIRDDVERGLSVMSSRADSLARFLSAYSRVARLPRPQPIETDLASIVERVAALESGSPVELSPGPDVRVLVDPAQIEQALVNLLKNAVEACQDTAGSVTIGWRASDSEVEIFVDDQGPGLANPDNLFVPFYTTKPGGSGIGLALSRRIVEAHGGTLALEPNPAGRGCRARLRLPRESRKDFGASKP